MPGGGGGEVVTTLLVAKCFIHVDLKTDLPDNAATMFQSAGY